LNKAYTAASFQQPTKELAAVAGQSWFQSLVVSSNGRIMPGAGALPGVEGGNVVGAIAVSGGTEDQDQRCREVALAAYTGDRRPAFFGGKEALGALRSEKQVNPANADGKFPTPYLGRSVRIVGNVVNVDMNQSPHPKNSRGELGKPLFNWYNNTVSKDPLTR